MKKFTLVAAMTAGLVASAGPAMAEPVSPADAPSAIAVAGSSSEDVFCAVIKFLKGGWAGRVTDCSF
ncbi:hypothetical protein [Nocardia xishanensis]|uniref:hypothetical protein n=1 Tax=Nocardia xishanensis TaxID=238964 RepID=UPI000B20ED08|nr:hypothetical protein [Nocardia xishanensis]